MVERPPEKRIVGDSSALVTTVTAYDVTWSSRLRTARSAVGWVATPRGGRYRNPGPDEPVSLTIAGPPRQPGEMRPGAKVAGDPRVSGRRVLCKGPAVEP